MIRSAAVVAPSPVPMRLGGAERHWETLRRSMEDAGIATDLVKLPVREHNLVDLLDGYEDFRLLDLSHVDLVISGKYPAWMVQHPNHVVWMLHPLRGLYDTYNPAAHEAAELPSLPEMEQLVGMVTDGALHADPVEVIDLVRAISEQLGPAASEPGGPLAVPSTLAAGVVRLLDEWALSPKRIRRHFAISGVVASRESYFAAGVHPGVIVPPSCLDEPPRSTPGTGLLSVGRLDGAKRVDLAIRAFADVEDPSATLTVLGDGPERERLESMAAADHRVGFRGRVTDEELADAYAAAAAVVVPPLEEDFGYVAIEAMQAGRAVLTTTDSGGPAELATDYLDAIVVQPTQVSLGAAMQRVLQDSDLCERLGEAGRATAAAHSWPAAVRQLIAPPFPPRVAEGRRGRIVAVSSYPVADWPGGGPERARHLLGGLANDGWEVEVVAIAPEHPRDRHVLAGGLYEVGIAPSQRHAAAEKRLRRLTANVSVSDVAASVLWSTTPDLVRELVRSLDGASAAIAVQPYLAAAVLEIAPEVPLVLDDHNHERALKAQMLPDDEAGHWMLDRVAEAEGTAATHAALVVATTGADARALEADHDLEPGSVLVVPNGVAVDEVPFTPPEQRRSNREALLHSLDTDAAPQAVALFVGSAHGPNVDAAREILELAPRFPQVLFVLAGEHSDQVEPHEVSRNVCLMGAVDTGWLAEMMAGADIALNPMRTGGGSNLKVLGYFAAGIPVLSTPMGVRGIPDPDQHAVVARPDQLAAALGAMLAESPPGSSGGRVEAARQLVEKEFDWGVLAPRFSNLVGDLIGDLRRSD